MWSVLVVCLLSSALLCPNLLSPRVCEPSTQFEDGGRDCSNGPNSCSNVYIGTRFVLLMCASVHEEIVEAQSQGHTNLYLNYRKLSEFPEELLTLSKIKKLYLKRNVLKKLVRSITHVDWKTYAAFFCRSIVLTVCTFALQPADIWKLGNLVEL